jgi:hypothetical protein
MSSSTIYFQKWNSWLILVEFEGYTPMFQGNNASPHQDKAYMKFVTEYCTDKGWHWEPQATQMPHMNVLDLLVFPPMSQRHIAKGWERGGLCVLSEGDIWETDLGFEWSFQMQRCFRMGPSTPYCSTCYQGRGRQQIPWRWWHTPCWSSERFPPDP